MNEELTVSVDFWTYDGQEYPDRTVHGTVDEMIRLLQRVKETGYWGTK